MSDYTRAENKDLYSNESASIANEINLLRNFLHRVAADGSRDFNALQYLQGIAANTSSPPLPEYTKVLINSSAVTNYDVVPAVPNARIVVVDLFLSCNDAVNITFVDSNGNNIWGAFYAPNAGQGFSQHFNKGLWLPKGEPLAHTSSAAVDYSISVNYTIVEY
jgi:hypothetical protein